MEEASRKIECIRVVAATLDPLKSWFALSKSLCGVRPRDFAKNAVFTRFPSEICCVATRELSVYSDGGKRRPYEAQLFESSTEVNRQRGPSKTYAASTFGLIAGIFRQRELPSAFLDSSLFECVKNCINGASIEDANFGANSQTSLSGPGKLSSGGNVDENQEANLPRHGTPSSKGPNITDIKTSPIGPTKKKKAIIGQCQTVFSAMSDVCDSYRESVGSILGNMLMHGSGEQQESVRTMLSEIADSICKTKGTSNCLTELFSADQYQILLSSMRVPDWALLFFKLQARLPDYAWQTLLNITRLGKSGVSKNIL